MNLIAVDQQGSVAFYANANNNDTTSDLYKQQNNTNTYMT